MPDGVAAIEVAAHEDPESGTSPAAGLLGELQGYGLERDDVVGPDGSLLLVAEEGVEIDALVGDEGGLGVGRQVRELRIVGRDELLAQVRVGGVEGREAQPLERLGITPSINLARTPPPPLTPPRSARAGLVRADNCARLSRSR